MNTELSDMKIQEWQANGPRYERRVITHKHVFATTSGKLFPLLCPTTEFDWIEGWHCELVYSHSGYHEYNAIFKTNFFNIEETWVVSRFEPNRAIEFVRISEHISVKFDISVCDNLDGTCTGSWVINLTALTSQGNDILRQMKPEEEPIGILIDALDHYIKNGTIKPLPAGIFDKRM